MIYLGRHNPLDGEKLSGTNILGDTTLNANGFDISEYQPPPLSVPIQYWDFDISQYQQPPLTMPIQNYDSIKSLDEIVFGTTYTEYNTSNADITQDNGAGISISDYLNGED